MNEIGPYLASLPNIVGSSAGSLMSLGFPLLEMLLHSLATSASSLG